MFGLSPATTSLLGAAGLYASLYCTYRMLLLNYGRGSKLVIGLFGGILVSLSIYMLVSHLIGVIAAAIALAVLVIRNMQKNDGSQADHYSVNSITGVPDDDDSLTPERRAQLESLAYSIAGISAPAPGQPVPPAGPAAPGAPGYPYVPQQGQAPFPPQLGQVPPMDYPPQPGAPAPGYPVGYPGVPGHAPPAAPYPGAPAPGQPPAAQPGQPEAHPAAPVPPQQPTPPATPYPAAPMPPAPDAPAMTPPASPAPTPAPSPGPAAAPPTLGGDEAIDSDPAPVTPPPLPSDAQAVRSERPASGEAEDERSDAQSEGHEEEANRRRLPPLPGD